MQIGAHCCKLGKHGNLWQLLAIFEFLLQLLRTSGNQWQLTVICGNLWKLLEMIGNFWQLSVAVSGSLWPSVAVSGSFNFFKLIISIGLSAAGAKADCANADCALPTILSSVESLKFLEI